MLNLFINEQGNQTTALEAACAVGCTEIVLALLTHPDIDVNCKKKGKV